MIKEKHIQTDFVKFIIEKYSKPDPIEVEEEQDETIDEEPQDDEEIEEIDKIIDEEEDEVLEKLLTEYKKIKRIYENRRIQNRGK